MSFSPTDAALEGFRAARAHPGAVALWAALYLIVGIGVVVLMLVTVGVGALAALGSSASEVKDPADLGRIFGSFLGVIGVLIPVFLLLGVVALCGVYRMVLRPQEKGFAYLRLGGDELRVLVTMIALTLVYMVVAGLPAGGVLFGVMVLRKSNVGLAVLTAMLGGLSVFCLMVWVGVRLSLAYVDTFSTRSIRVFSSWRITRGHFWPLLGMYLLVIVLVTALSIGGAIVQSAFQLIGAGGMAGLAHSHDASTTAAALPALLLGGLATIAISLILAVLQLLVNQAPQAAAYRALTGGADAAEVF